jgi:hypothetical protein
MSTDEIDETDPHNKLMLSLFDNQGESPEIQIKNLSEILLENSHVLPIEKHDHQFVRELCCRGSHSFCILTCIYYIIKNVYTDYFQRHTNRNLESLLYFTINHGNSNCTLCKNNIRYYDALLALRRLDKTIPDYTTGSWNERKHAVICQWI